MQSIKQHYFRETEEQNSNGCKMLVKKDAMLDSPEITRYTLTLTRHRSFFRNLPPL